MGGPGSGKKKSTVAKKKATGNMIAPKPVVKWNGGTKKKK